jgi:hypothetical protein
MRRRPAPSPARRATLRAALSCALVLAAGGVFASSGSASPLWLVNGSSSFSSGEIATGTASNAYFEFFGLKTTCSTTKLGLEIGNPGGVGLVEATSLSLLGCSTNTVCTVEAVEAQGLPWPAHLATVSGGNYVVLEGVEVEILYGNPICVLNETVLPIEGTAGGLFTNAPAKLAFNPASFAATGTELSAFGSGIEWSATFTMAANGGTLGLD